MDYRVYFLDAENHIRRAVDLQCEDDETALARVQNLDWGGHQVEVWQLGRMVRRFARKPD